MRKWSFRHIETDWNWWLSGNIIVWQICYSSLVTVFGSHKLAGEFRIIAPGYNIRLALNFLKRGKCGLYKIRNKVEMDSCFFYSSWDCHCPVSANGFNDKRRGGDPCQSLAQMILWRNIIRCITCGLTFTEKRSSENHNKRQKDSKKENNGFIQLCLDCLNAGVLLLFLYTGLHLATFS